MSIVEKLYDRSEAEKLDGNVCEGPLAQQVDEGVDDGLATWTRLPLHDPLRLRPLGK